MKSPGADGIFPALLKSGFEIILGSFLRVVRDNVSQRQIPRARRPAKVIFIPIVGTKGSFHPKSFNSICRACLQVLQVREFEREE